MDYLPLGSRSDVPIGRVEMNSGRGCESMTSNYKGFGDVIPSLKRRLDEILFLQVTTTCYAVTWGQSPAQWHMTRPKQDHH